MTSQPQAIGIAWYREADYDALCALFTDGDLLPSTFLQWQDKAEQLRKRYLREGYVVVKAHIEPQGFAAWCRTHGKNLDASGRTAFANAEAYKVLMETRVHHGSAHADT